MYRRIENDLSLVFQLKISSFHKVNRRGKCLFLFIIIQIAIIKKKKFTRFINFRDIHTVIEQRIAL